MADAECDSCLHYGSHLADGGQAWLEVGPSSTWTLVLYSWAVVRQQNVSSWSCWKKQTFLVTYVSLDTDAAATETVTPSWALTPPIPH